MDSRPALQLLGDRRFNNRSVATSMSDGEFKLSLVVTVLVGWLYVTMALLLPATLPTNFWIGPNSSILVEPNSIFVQSVKVESLYGSESGLQLFGFYASPLVDVVNWSESRLVSLSHRSYKGWPYYLNEGSSLNISCNVKPEGSSVRLVVDKAVASERLLQEPPYDMTTLSLNLVKGSGVIQVNISKSESYHLNVVNPNLKDVEVELDIDVRAVVYDTKEPPFYKCNFSNSCTFSTMPFVGTSIVLTSPAHRQGVLAEEQEWFIKVSYQGRWTSYAIVTGLFVCFVLVAIQLYTRSQHAGEDRYVTDDDSSISLLVNKDDDVSSICSWPESFAAYDADREDFNDNESEASYTTRTCCAICFDAQRDCFFLPCGHCVTCYLCGTKISEAVANCPICRKKIKKVKQIYTV